MSLVNRLLPSKTNRTPLESSYPEFEQFVADYGGRAKPLVEQTRERVREAKLMAGDMSADACRGLYAATVALDADVVVETGVASGVSTTALLAAVDRTGGHVISVDLPFHTDDDLETRRASTYEEFGGAAVPAGETSGWAIPDSLRDRWTLHEGKSQRLLPEVLADLDGVDLFVHDSEHSRLCASMELELAWPRLRRGGIVACDDISWSGAWDEFVERRVSQEQNGKLAGDVGFAIKGESDE